MKELNLERKVERWGIGIPHLKLRDYEGLPDILKEGETYKFGIKRLRCFPRDTKVIIVDRNNYEVASVFILESSMDFSKVKTEGSCRINRVY